MCTHTSHTIVYFYIAAKFEHRYLFERAQARGLVVAAGIESEVEYVSWHARPLELPPDPSQHYAFRGWTGWPAFLGQNQDSTSPQPVQPSLEVHPPDSAATPPKRRPRPPPLPYQEAQQRVQQATGGTLREPLQFLEWHARNGAELEIPREPERVYRCVCVCVCMCCLAGEERGLHL